MPVLRGYTAFSLANRGIGMALPTRRYRKTARPSPGDSPWAIFAALIFLAVGICVFAHFYYLPSTQTAMSSSPAASPPATVTAAPAPTAPPPAPVAAPVPPPGGVDDNILNRERADTDDLVATYARDWVIVDGQRLTGITSAVAAPQYQVTIASSSGGKNIPASSFPPGFLSLWSITPQALEAANQPKDKTNP